MSESPVSQPKAPILLSLGRHAIPILALIGVHSIAKPKTFDVLTQWFIGIAFVVVGSLIVAGVATIYSKSRDAAAFAVRARNTAWVIVLLLLLSLAPDYLKLPKPVSPEMATSTSVPAQAQRERELPAVTSPPTAGRWPLNPEGAALLRKIRKDYPDLEGQSDEQVARAVHEAFYKDLPLEEVAAKLGIRLRE